MMTIKKIYDLICRGEEIVAGAFMVAIMVIVFAAGFGRTIGYPIQWGMEMSTFLFAWVVFLSADAAWRKNKHVSVEVLVSKLPTKLQYYITLFNHCLIFGFLLLLVGYGIPLCYHTRFRTFQGIPGFSYMWATLSVPVGSALLSITAVLKIRELVKHGKVAIFETGNEGDMDIDI
ncbi:MAG TPA: TRAP transporter small permease [Candidatus Atribacteria bacterium]|nr:TRAP transporter small permease [Candidatus Atribacteria bacterium]HPT63619.1 TRAP transporter small permease [Candidatus Atribacteria bacterium]